MAPGYWRDGASRTTGPGPRCAPASGWALLLLLARPGRVVGRVGVAGRRGAGGRADRGDRPGPGLAGDGRLGVGQALAEGDVAGLALLEPDDDRGGHEDRRVHADGHADGEGDGE